MLPRQLRLHHTTYIGQMARDLKKTPLVEVRWCGLEKEPKKNRFEPSKPATWEVEILLENDNKEHMAWCEEVEALFEELHPGKKKSANWLPIKPDKEEPRKRQVCRMKLKQWIRDGVSSEGPTVFDGTSEEKKGLQWDSATAIGNGSKMIIGYDVFAWEGPTGAGLSLQPRAAQVIEHMAFEGAGTGITASDFGFASSKEADAAVLAAYTAASAPQAAEPEPAAEPTDDIPF